eukprot:TRINITY_DN6648_c0_g1_i1.p1 TRINITY_DN6648_c0_g1~~TRINITY_DN6648_c0_g1_i1.p1  ORF type:complete len:541 (+),score=184.98 TRINITY_DN6648_c0_g1_i1:126-1625(+)
MGCGASGPCAAQRGNAQKIFVSRYRPGPESSPVEDGQGEDGAADQVVARGADRGSQQGAQFNPVQLTCPSCGCRLPSTPYCAMTGQRHTLFVSTQLRENAEERADRLYLMAIYDSPTLLAELLSYVGHGTNLEKWTPGQQQPQLRQFWLEASNSALPDPNASLWWKGKRPRHESLPLRDVERIVLGRRSPPNALSQGVRAHSPVVQDLYLRSFSLICHDAAGVEPIEVTAAAVQEFEAWVISLTRVIGVVPRWNEIMDISDSPLLPSLDMVERETCATHCVPPALYLQVMQLLRRKRDRVRGALGWTPSEAGSPETTPVKAEPEGEDDTEGEGADLTSDAVEVAALKAGITPPRVHRVTGALFVTKGELRYWTRCDIFRTCAMWCLLSRKNIIFDPDFEWACPRMELYAPWHWSVEEHCSAPRAFQRTVRTVLGVCSLRRPHAAVAAAAERSDPAAGSARAAARRLSHSPSAASIATGPPWQLPGDLLYIVFEYLPRFP